MSDKFKSATKLPELRVVLFLVFGVALWLFLVAGMGPVDQSAFADNLSASSAAPIQIAAPLE